MSDDSEAAESVGEAGNSEMAAKIDRLDRMRRREDHPNHFAKWTPGLTALFDSEPDEFHYAIYLWMLEAYARADESEEEFSAEYFRGLTYSLVIYGDHLGVQMQSLVDFMNVTAAGQFAELRGFLQLSDTHYFQAAEHAIYRLKARAEQREFDQKQQQSKANPGLEAAVPGSTGKNTVANDHAQNRGRKSKGETNQLVVDWIKKNKTMLRNHNGHRLHAIIVAETGASHGGVSESPAYRALMKEIKARRPSAPRAIANGHEILESYGRDDTELEALIEEQAEDDASQRFHRRT